MTVQCLRNRLLSERSSPASLLDKSSPHGSPGKGPWPGFFFGLVLLINSSGGLQGRSGTPGHRAQGPAVMLFTGFSLFGALRVEWHERHEGHV